MANPKGSPQNLKSFVPTKGKEKAFDSGIHLKLYKHDKNALKQIPDWTDKLRAAITELIEREKASDETSSSAA